MNLAAEPQNNKLAEIGGIIRLAQAMKAAALGAPTAVAAQAMMDNLKALSIEAGLVDPSGNIAKMIYNFTQEAYKRVEQLATEEAAAQSSREGIMGDPVKYPFTPEERNVATIADFLRKNVPASANVLKAVEITDPSSELKIITFDAAGRPADAEISGRRMRENAILVQARINESKLDPATIKARNMILYGHEDGPRNAEERKAGNARVQQAVEEMIGRSGYIKRERAGEDPTKRQGAEQEAKKKVQDSRVSSHNVDRLEEQLASFQENPPQDAMGLAKQTATKAELDSAKKKQNDSYASASDEWASDTLGVTPSQQQQQNIPVQLATGQDNTPAGGSPLPAGAPAVASARSR